MPLSKEQRKEFDRNRYQKRKDRALAYLGNECISCGTQDDLQFDHIDRADKSFTITSKLAGGKWSLIEQELDKCQLLCLSCHQDKSIKDLDHNSRYDHGTIVAYNRGKCRCDACRKVWNAASKEHKRISRERKKENCAGMVKSAS